MRLLHDRLYGEGTGRIFLRGDYLADLPRAVGERIKVVFGAQARAPSALNEGDKLKVVNVGANDALKMREDATADSRIIDMIPPNTEGVIYLGEAQGQWIFVSYARSKGWVHRSFVQLVQPVPSRGGRF
jgi:SH3-like domain-containing protein